MNRREFMERLRQLLADVPHSEREEVLQYYEDYFADAGEEKEAEVLAGLGTPEQLAERIKADLQGNEPEGEFTERGYTESYGEGRTYEQASSYTEPYGEGRTESTDGKSKKWDKNQILLIVLLCILASPLILGVGGGIFGVVFGGIAALFGILIGVTAAAVAVLATGVGLIAAGCSAFFAGPALGLALIGAGFLVLALGILLMALSISLWGLLPKLFKGIAKLIRRMFRGKEAQV